MKKITLICSITFLKTRFIVTMIFIGVMVLSSIKGYSQTRNNYKEKVHLHFDKPYYTSGENIWFKAYLVEAKTNKPIALSKVLYVELIDPLNKIMLSKTIKVEAHGTAGDFQLPSELTSGKYMVRAYTNYMRNFDNTYFFRKELQINNLQALEFDGISKKRKRKRKDRKNIKTAAPTPDLQLFPEGGNMVNNISNRIGFKAIGTNGKGISITGAIIDNNGVEKIKISTFNLGMGMFALTPEEGKSYKALIDYQGETYTYPLPKGLEKGIAMLVINSENKFRIHLQSSLSKSIKNFMLVGRQRGETVFSSLLKGNNPKKILNISKENLTQGIIRFTLYDKNKKPLCERLAFVEKTDFEPIVNISPSKKIFKKRELVTIDLSLKNQQEEAIQADLSLAVTDLGVVGSGFYETTIKSQLLLDSELKGVIEHPNYYFESDAPKRKASLDLLMMCQGWRRYIWNDIMIDNIKNYPYAIEKGFSFTGSIKKFFNSKKTAVTDVSLLMMNKNSFDNLEIKTNDKGQFEFGDFDITDSTIVIIQAKNYRTNKGKAHKKAKKPLRSYSIMLNSIKAPKITREIFQIKTTNDSLFESYISRSKQTQYNDSLFAAANGTIMLAGIKLKTVKSKIKSIKDKKRLIYRQTSQSIDFEDIPYVPALNPLKVLQGRVPGININNDGTVQFITSRSLTQGNALILLDGTPIDNANLIDASEIDFIDILKRSNSAIYGSRGAAGVIAVYTKDAESELLKSRISKNKKIRQGIVNFVHPGFYHAKEFYAPKYKIAQPEHTKPDYRSTLYWNPTVEIDAQGKAKISFYSSDISTTYRVALEGLTADGIPITEDYFIEIHE